MNDLGGYFDSLRKNKRHHLGLGDVRLTAAQQEAIALKFDALRLWIEGAGEQHDICTKNILGKVCSNCRCGKMEVGLVGVAPGLQL